MDVVVAAAADAVVSCAAIEAVVACAAVDRVRAAAAEDDVVDGIAGQDVCVLGAEHDLDRADRVLALAGDAASCEVHVNRSRRAGVRDAVGARSAVQASAPGPP